ncbi:hypothetical protein CXB51_021330 [Gossypium anomalum]|uniref:DUF4283 domain-containing protein n=1 Tax=Gossypium anomalum TaxID=47600 RepID=A0A8J6CWY9_9ROSI|nr:hypothetical protein CXB51_021330 [Gossypium anomalum]
MENSLNFGDNSSLPKVDDGGGSWADVDRNTKKVRFKEGNGEDTTDMLVESRSGPKISWKDKFLGFNPGASDKIGLDFSGAGANEDLEFLAGDIHRSIVNGIPAIDFSKRIQQILFKEIELTVFLKLLGRNIGRIRGRFARMVIYVNLDKPLIAQVLVNGLHQKVEYEALPTICFTYGKYGHTKELCALLQLEISLGKDQEGDTPKKDVNEG